MIKVAVTGGIGSGKSYVCELFRTIYGIPIYNTDKHAQEIMKRPHIRQRIIDEFGDDSYIGENLNKEKFRLLLFDNSEARKKMNHTFSAEILKDTNDWCNQQNTPYVIIECAIIFEQHLEHQCDKMVTVWCRLDVRLERLKNRYIGLTKEREADFIETHKKIIGIQIPDEEKIKKSDFVIENSGNDVIEEIKKIHEKISK